MIALPVYKEKSRKKKPTKIYIIINTEGSLKLKISHNPKAELLSQTQ